MGARSGPASFGHFFRQYTKTWMHAVSAAGLTAFGLLTVVHRGFVVLAIASYVVPPVVLYFTRGRNVPGDADETASPTDAALAPESDPGEGAPVASPVERDPASKRAARDRARADDTDRASVPPSPASDAPGARTDADGAEDGSGPDTETESEIEPADRRDRTADEPDTGARWTVVDSPTDATLFDVAITDAGAVAVGAGGVVLEADGDDWLVLLEDGSAASGQDLHGVDATADGEVAWVAGDGGAVGRVEVATGRHADHSAPTGRTDNLSGLAVAGTSDDETVLLINGSGEVLRGRYRDGELTWDEPVKPGSGSSLSGVDLVDDSTGYCCDTNDGVFETDDGGRTFETIGLEGAGGTLADVAGGRGECHTCTDAGVVHRYDGSTWTPQRVSDEALTAIDGCDDRLVVCDEGGEVHERPGSAPDWDRFETDASGALEGVAISDDRSVAVGGGGSVIERGPP